MKSERLKKLETELGDLEQWLKLGLVPKKEIERHQEEIRNLRLRIEEEKERLAFLKESGEIEEYTTPRRVPTKTIYPETPSMSEIGIAEEETEMTETGMDIETETVESETLTDVDKEERGVEEEEEEEELEEVEDPFSDRNRWRRGGIIDPDASEW